MAQIEAPCGVHCDCEGAFCCGAMDVRTFDVTFPDDRTRGDQSSVWFNLDDCAITVYLTYPFIYINYFTCFDLIQTFVNIFFFVTISLF